ncbi:MAG: hypothetical protein EBY80_16640 [Actinobacteria bacterium]|jgi:hypothetical protein|nr:hypothetical protein [Actinomycetota bacterium]
MIRNSFPRFVAPLVLASVLAVGCSSDDSTSTPTAPESTEQVAATPTDPTNTLPPTSTAAKDEPETGTPPTLSTNIEIDVESDAPVSASAVVGSPVRIHIVSDEESEFHLHGYDIELTGDDVVFDFVADQLGVFELEDHESGQLILTLEILAD